MSYDEFAQNFKDHPVPELIKGLFQYAEELGAFFAGTFEIYMEEQGEADLNAWFGEVDYRKDGTTLLAFAHDGVHSFYCYWLYPGKTIKDAPIVYLSSEFEGSTVIANDAAEFLSLLATNRDYSNYGNGEGSHFNDPEEDYEEESADFCAWLKEKHNILPAENPDKILETAKENHPDFQAWLGKVLEG